jgi:hypothetical protein
MDGSIVLGCGQRKRLLEIYRGKEANIPVEARLRAHIVLLLCATIARWKERFESGGLEALLKENRGRTATLLVGWAWLLVSWLKTLTPRYFGYCRSRWCLGVVRHAAGEGERGNGAALPAWPESGVASAAAGAGTERPAAAVEAAENPRIAEGFAAG